MKPGRYNDQCTRVREETDGELVLVIVVNGNQGQGFAVQGTPELVGKIPAILRHAASLIEMDPSRGIGR